MRRGRVGPRADDRELGAVVAFGDEALADLARDVGLGPPDEPAVGDLVDHPVGGLGGEPEEGDLVGVLHDPQLAQGERCGLEGDAGERGLEPQEVERPEPVGDADAGGRRRQQAADAGNGVLRLLPRRDGHGAGDDGRAAAGRGGLQPRHEERDGAFGGHDEHRQPLERQGRVPGEVDEVGPDADEQRVEAAVADGGPGTLDPLGEAGGGNGRPARSGRGDGVHAGGTSPGPAGRGDVPGARRRHRDPQPGRQRGVAVLEELAVGDDALGAGRASRGAQVLVVVLADAEDAEPGGGGPRGGVDPVVGTGGQVDDGPGRARRRRAPPRRPRVPTRIGVAPSVRSCPTRRVAQMRSSARTITISPAAGRRGASAARAPGWRAPRPAHRTVQVSLPPRRSASSPCPCFAIASRICASTSSSCVGRGTLRMTPIGTGNSGQ